MTESIIKSILKTCQDMGFVVVAMVSDLGGGNRSLMNELNVSYENPW